MTETIHPMEDSLHLTSLGQIEKGGLTAGFFILGGNSKGSELSKLVIKFPVECQGIHQLQRSQSQYEAINQAFATGFKELTGCTITFRSSSFCYDTDNYDQTRGNLTCPPSRQNSLNSQNSVSKESFYFTQAGKARTQELIKKNSLNSLPYMGT